MLKPNTPGIPGMGAMTDTLEFVKNLWGSMGIPGLGTPGATTQGMNIPGMVMPTLSVEDIRKKISDLRAIESWLELNMNMLRGTIQALEVQAATIATLQSMGEALSATVSAGAAAGAVQGMRAQTPEPEPESEPPARAKTAEAPEPTSKDEADAATLTAPLVNAAAWWNMLQEQFRQAVSNAMTAEPQTPNGHDTSAPKARAKPAASAKPDEQSPRTASATPARKRSKSSK